MDHKTYMWISRVALLAALVGCLLAAGSAFAAASASWNIGINQSTVTLLVDDGSQGLAFRAVTSGDTATIDARAGYPIGNLHWFAHGTYTCADNVVRSFSFSGSSLSDRSVTCPLGLTVKNFSGTLTLN